MLIYCLHVALRELVVSHAFLWHPIANPWGEKWVMPCSVSCWHTGRGSSTIWEQHPNTRSCPAFKGHSLFPFCESPQTSQLPKGHLTPESFSKASLPNKQAADSVCGNWLAENTCSILHLCFPTQGEEFIMGLKDDYFLSVV